MGAARMHDRLGAKALNVLALPAPHGWMYLAEVVAPEFDGEVRTRAVSYTPYPSAVSALAQGMAHARVMAAGRTGGYEPATEMRYGARTMH